MPSVSLFDVLVSPDFRRANQPFLGAGSETSSAPAFSGAGSLSISSGSMTGGSGAASAEAAAGALSPGTAAGAAGSAASPCGCSGCLSYLTVPDRGARILPVDRQKGDQTVHAAWRVPRSRHHLTLEPATIVPGDAGPDQRPLGQAGCVT